MKEIHIHFIGNLWFDANLKFLKHSDKLLPINELKPCRYPAPPSAGLMTAERPWRRLHPTQSSSSECQWQSGPCPPPMASARRNPPST
jgi:hypothetical protein